MSVVQSGLPVPEIRDFFVDEVWQGARAHYRVPRTPLAQAITQALLSGGRSGRRVLCVGSVGQEAAES